MEKFRAKLLRVLELGRCHLGFIPSEFGSEDFQVLSQRGQQLQRLKLEFKPESWEISQKLQHKNASWLLFINRDDSCIVYHHSHVSDLQGHCKPLIVTSRRSFHDTLLHGLPNKFFVPP
ncbi:hypothetical protein ILYODFUR_004127 [Ilyodon furcidens]|uniref:Uncharacterized protein n=1 Tax=Ilyodon furcidens TaxID=33524 RepID=A0ABV0SLL4_9TELE